MTQKIINFTEGGRRVAVVGGGISGITAAHLIARDNDVVLFESEPRLGGHTYTVETGAEGASRPVDMGFIVCNEPNYPTFLAFMDELGVVREESDMSFAYYEPESGFRYAGTGLGGLFARPRNALSIPFWRMFLSIPRFCREARRDIRAGMLKGLTIGEYLRMRGFGRDFEERYLLPMAGSIWSAPEGRAQDFPAEALVRFFENHALLDYLSRPPWLYIRGGSSTYVRAFEAGFPGEIRAGTPVESVRRSAEGVEIRTAGDVSRFDAVVLATHADISFRLLADPGPEEQRLLSPWTYAANRTVLHTDESFLPPGNRARASWNYIRESDRAANAPVGVSYHMNRLQRIPGPEEFVVTLNPRRNPAGLIEDVTFDHPQYSLDALATQDGLGDLNGVNRTFFCGAYQGYGFHEDGARSGARVARHFGQGFAALDGSGRDKGFERSVS